MTAAAAPRQRVVFTVHKAASMLLETVCAILAERLDCRHHSQNGTDDPLPPAWRYGDGHILSGREGVIGPLRFPLAASFIDGPIVVHLRDPRDVLVSLYFSHAYSHDLAAMDRDEAYRELVLQKGIDAFVRGRAVAYANRYRTYLNRILTKPGVRLVRYETMIEAPHRWAQAFVDALLADQPQAVREGACRAVVEAIVPKEPPGAEDPAAHIRQRTPGDHRAKLRPQTIVELDRRFADVLNAMERLSGGPAPEAESPGGAHETSGRTETS